MELMKATENLVLTQSHQSCQLVLSLMEDILALVEILVQVTQAGVAATTIKLIDLSLLEALRRTSLKSSL